MNVDDHVDDLLPRKSLGLGPALVVFNIQLLQGRALNEEHVNHQRSFVSSAIFKSRFKMP